MDWTSLRRIITTNAGGKSRVLIDGDAAKQIAVEENGLAEIWTALLSDGAQLSEIDKLASENLKLEPDEGALKVRWFTVPVEDKQADPEQIEAKAAFGFAAVEASHARVDTSRHPMMHKTKSMDVIILIKGEVDLLLDNGEAKNLKPGDVVIQQATNHAWVNTGTQTALLVAILVDTANS